CQSSGLMLSSGRPSWPRTPPALFTRMSTCPLSEDASATNASTARLSVTSTTRAWQHAELPAASLRRCDSCSSSESTSQIHTRAPRSANATLMARPNPCAAPVTTTLCPLNERFILHLNRRQRGELVERGERLGLGAALDGVHELAAGGGGGCE